MRFEPDREKHIPDHGAQCILEEYISRWKLRIKEAHEPGEDVRTSSGADHAGAQSSRKQTPPSTVDEETKKTDKQLPSQELSTESSETEPISEASNAAQGKAISAEAVQSSSAPKTTSKADMWTIADAIVDQVRQARAEASKGYYAIFGKSSVQSRAED